MRQGGENNFSWNALRDAVRFERVHYYVRAQPPRLSRSSNRSLSLESGENENDYENEPDLGFIPSAAVSSRGVKHTG